ncbi:MAG TPA: GFA family protein [Aestuariivirgaceae bacterium]|nr:GFA family protein [Aestuariivirgaceae bacterium]
MRIDGQCHCGFITYEAEIDPEQVEICHCTDCQTLSGTAFRTVVSAKGESFRLLSGQPTVYVKTAESGNKRRQAFCPECGTSIYSSAAEDDPRFFGIRVGTIRQRDSLPPKTQYWSRSAQRWLAGLTSIPHVERE